MLPLGYGLDSEAPLRIGWLCFIYRIASPLSGSGASRAIAFQSKVLWNEGVIDYKLELTCNLQSFSFFKFVTFMRILYHSKVTIGDVNMNCNKTT